MRKDAHDLTRLGYVARRVRQHAYWARTQGIQRLVEEDELNPATRLRAASARRSWRRSHPRAPGQAMPVYVVGLQRSGTNMLVRGLQSMPQFEVHNENDRRLFHRFQLRSDAQLRKVILASRQQYVLVKPLCETYRVDELLALPGPVPGRAIWAYRDVDDRARSDVAKFGTANLDAMRAVADGTAGNRWQARRLDENMRELIMSFDFGTMTPHSGAALFWYVRNNFFFSLGLDDRSDVMISRYETLAATPDAVMHRMADFLGLDYDPRLGAHIESRTPRRRPLPIDPRLRQLCDELTQRLDSVAARDVPLPEPEANG